MDNNNGETGGVTNNNNGGVTSRTTTSGAESSFDIFYNPKNGKVVQDEFDMTSQDADIGAIEQQQEQQEVEGKGLDDTDNDADEENSSTAAVISTILAISSTLEKEHAETAKVEVPAILIQESSSKGSSRSGSKNASANSSVSKAKEESTTLNDETRSKRSTTPAEESASKKEEEGEDNEDEATLVEEQTTHNSPDISTTKVEDTMETTNRSFTSSALSGYVNKVFHEAKTNLATEAKLNRLPHPPSTAPTASMTSLRSSQMSTSSRSSSVISHYLKDMIDTAAKDVGTTAVSHKKKPMKQQKSLQFGKMNESVISSNSITSNDLQDFVGDVLVKASKGLREEEIIEESSNNTSQQEHSIDISKKNTTVMIDELDEPEADSDLDSYIEDVIKRAASEISMMEEENSLQMEFDENDLKMARPKTTSSVVGKKGSSISESRKTEGSIKADSVLSRKSDTLRSSEKIKSRASTIDTKTPESKNRLTELPALSTDRTSSKSSSKRSSKLDHSMPIREQASSRRSKDSYMKNELSNLSIVEVSQVKEKSGEVLRTSGITVTERQEAEIQANSESSKILKSSKNKKLQVDLSPRRDRSRSKRRHRRVLDDSYQLFDDSFVIEKDAAVQTTRLEGASTYYESSRIFTNGSHSRHDENRSQSKNTIGIQVEAAGGDDKRLLKREKSRKRNLDYRRIFYYYHEELRKLQNHGPRVEKALESHIERMKLANKNILKQEMYENDINNVLIAPAVVYSLDADFQASSNSSNEIGGFCTDSAKLSKVAYDARRDEVKLRNRMLYGSSSNRPLTSQTFEPKLLKQKRQFLPFGTILKVPDLHLGHQKLSDERQREIVARLHDSHIESLRKKEVGS